MRFGNGSRAIASSRFFSRKVSETGVHLSGFRVYICEPLGCTPEEPLGVHLRGSWVYTCRRAWVYTCETCDFPAAFAACGVDGTSAFFHLRCVS